VNVQHNKVTIYSGQFDLSYCTPSGGTEVSFGQSREFLTWSRRPGMHSLIVNDPPRDS